MNRADHTAVYADTLEHIAHNMRRLRQRRHWTQEVASGFAGVYVRHWQKLETGHQNMCVDTLFNIAVGLGLEYWTELLTKPPAVSPLRQSRSRREGALPNLDDPDAVYAAAIERIARNMRHERMC